MPEYKSVDCCGSITSRMANDSDCDRPSSGRRTFTRARFQPRWKPVARTKQWYDGRRQKEKKSKNMFKRWMQENEERDQQRDDETEMDKFENVPEDYRVDVNDVHSSKKEDSLSRSYVTRKPVREINKTTPRMTFSGHKEEETISDEKALCLETFNLHDDKGKGKISILKAHRAEEIKGNACRSTLRNLLGSSYQIAG